MPGRGVVPRSEAELRRAPARARRGRGRRRHRRAFAVARAARAHVRRPARAGRARARRPASGSGSVPATASSRTCRTSPRRSSHSSRPRASARSGRRARRSSACAACCTGSASSSRRSCSRSPATAGATSSSTAASRWPRSARACRAWRPSSTSPTRAAKATSFPTRARGTSCCGTRGRSSSSPCRSPTRSTSSSRPGTTALPKAIVHGHGGILLEHLKNHCLSWDLRPGDRLQWFTTTAWMMWNALVSTLLVRASIVMIDGNPAYPDLSYQWQLAETTRPTMLGVSPAFVLACRKEGLEPGRRFDLTSIRTIGAAGSPLPVEGFEWLYEQFDPGVQVNLGSGGTDICTGIVQGYPLLPVYAGEMSGRCLAVDAQALGPDGEARGRRARRARDRPADAVDARRALERPRRLARPRRLLRPLPGPLAARRLDRLRRARQLGDHRPLRRDAQPRRRPARHERVLRRRRGARRGRSTAWSSTSTTRTSCCCSWRYARGWSWTTSCGPGSPGRCGRRSRPATSRTRSSPCRRSRAR